MSEALAYTPLMSADDFAVWPGDGVHKRHQLIDGVPVGMPASSWRHGAIAMEMGARIRNHLREHRLGCIVASEPGIQTRVGRHFNVRIPDLAVSCRPGTGHYFENPILLVEVLSPSNVAETREAVRACLTIPSLTEVLIIDSRQVRAELLQRRADHAWPEEPEPLGADDEVRLASINLRFALAEIYPVA